MPSIHSMQTGAVQESNSYSHILSAHVRKVMTNKTKRNWGAIVKVWLQGGNLGGNEIFDIGSLD